MLSKSIFFAVFLYFGGELTASKVTIFLSVGSRLINWMDFFNAIKGVYRSLVRDEELINSILDHPESEIFKIVREPDFGNPNSVILTNGCFFWAENGKVDQDKSGVEKKEAEVERKGILKWITIG